MHRLGAVAFGLVLFLGFELLCRLAGWGKSESTLEPLFGFSSTEPLFALNESGARYETRSARLKFFVHDSFRAEKSKRGFRVFCLGGSTVQGRPYARETSFTTWLRLSLEAADPQREWEVINCGGVSYASYRLVPILRECLRYQPDLIIVCTGHNEFLEDRSYKHIKRIPSVLRNAGGRATRLRTYRLLEKAFAGMPAKPDDDEKESAPLLTAEADALLDYRDGIEAYRRDDAWHSDVVDHFQHNVALLEQIASQAGVPLVYLCPPSNLKDCPPFKSQHRDGLSERARVEWKAHVNEAVENYASDLSRSLALLQQALKIDSRHALTHFRLGKCYESIGDRVSAQRSFLRALEEDICPLRMTAEMASRLQEVAEHRGTALLDLQMLLRQECRLGIVGDEILVDHVHPSIRGHQMIAAAITKEVFLEPGLVKPVDREWTRARDASYQKHIGSLDALYFAHGKRRLDNLRAWTEGRADGPPIGEKPGAGQRPGD